MNSFFKKHSLTILKTILYTVLFQVVFSSTTNGYAAENQWCHAGFVAPICYQTKAACESNYSTGCEFKGTVVGTPIQGKAAEKPQVQTPTNVSPEGYSLLAPIPTVEPGTQPDLVTYMKGLFTLLVGLSIVFAVLKIVIGGIKYVTGSIPSTKSDGKGDITAALTGLLLVLISSVLLNTLNPGLLHIGLNLDTIVFETVTTIDNESGGGTGSSIGSGGDISGSTSSTNTGGAVSGGTTGTFTKQSDAVNRDRITKSGVTFNPVVRGHVVSTEGMRDTTVDAIIGLKTGCPSCNIKIASGTDGKHSTKGQYSHINGYKVDLQQTPSLTAHIKSIATDTGRIRGGDGARLYLGKDGIEYWKENTIWDIVVKPK